MTLSLKKPTYPAPGLDTFPKLLLHNARMFTDKDAMREKEFGIWQSWTWSQVAEEVERFALGLQANGVKAGDTVLIIGGNRPRTYWTMCAVQSLGAVPVPTYHDSVASEMQFVIEHSDARVIVAEDQEQVDKILDVKARCPSVELIIYDDPRGMKGYDPQEIKIQDFVTVQAQGEAIRKDNPNQFQELVNQGKGEDLSIILYTSGTTGNPKGAVSTHRAVLSALMAFACRATASAMMKPEDTAGHPYPNCFILAVPLFHVTGCVAVMLSCFASGTRLVMMYKWSPERALELIERERVTHFVGVPTMSWDLLESPDFPERDTSSLLSVGGGGAPTPPELVRRIDANFKSGRPGIGYGMTETNAYGPQNAGDDYMRKPTSAGRVVPTVQLRVTGENDVLLPTGEVGEIWFRGANLIRGYWNNPEATAETLVDGWLRSGDIGRIDEEGFIYVQDRAKDMVLRGGENIYCAEVEAALYEHGDVYEAAVFGLPHERLGEEVAAVIHPKPGRVVDVGAIRDHVAQRLAAFKVPSYIEVTETPLPRNPAGKFLKRELREEIASRREA